MAAVTTVDLPGLTKIATGKVREMFVDEDDQSSLLFVATDRISAYDVVLANGIPNKANVLTQLTAYWFSVLSKPGVLAGQTAPLATHLLSLAPGPTAKISDAERAILRGRVMRVRRLRMFPVEAIVRGYLAGSAFAEYSTKGTVHGEPVGVADSGSDAVRFPKGMVRCQKLPAPVYTPSTKAELGAHDENISRAQAAALIGNPAHAARIEELALAVYTAAAEHALKRGVIIADTKFEFGLDEATGEVVLADEVLTPDSSRFWVADQYEAGREQDSLDKQFLRNWLVKEGLKGKEGVTMPPEIVEQTSKRYTDVYERLTGQTLEAALAKLE
ncbi:phosphoribosylaminoimidazole-succinocarboxamide synthase [Sporothrix brasiliensis 5110]|uniref:Phosphoribosylaminoimidazole-succinocarboxamide synthase n=1 Tax=Sporothrix brasiliensis 5110 TaxID=1398154 RepID=A0A0C2JCF9_9PEZI|nr:phosphoribosylaminoimidazole-succinocarboxamide synthase [Sporothrix brasiliensis 5110]KIH94617.1 phosphoribosylaminoimidazole-succinocarboxamide synthase [Sporothrix brasiliensis 5110]